MPKFEEEDGRPIDPVSELYASDKRANFWMPRKSTAPEKLLCEASSDHNVCGKVDKLTFPVKALLEMFSEVNDDANRVKSTVPLNRLLETSR